MVYEAASLGLSLQIEKCSFFPRHSMKALGTIVDLSSFTFRVAEPRIRKIKAAMHSLSCAVQTNPMSIPARSVASFIGLIWSIAVCCHRAASVMLRSVTAVLACSIRSVLQWSNVPLATLLSRFWSGSVQWTSAAQGQLNFWRSVDFGRLCAPISSDVLGKAVEAVVHYPDMVDFSSVSFLYQDASALAAGGGFLRIENGRLVPCKELFLALFNSQESQSSSTLRELLGILGCLVSTDAASKSKIIFACDNLQAVDAIKLGSRNPLIQMAAEAILAWCIGHNKVCWPMWLPRTDPIIKEGDNRGRLKIPHDDRSPQSVVNAANSLAMDIWGAGLSFDQAASHISAVTVNHRRLPFNAFCMQPGAMGVDTFCCWSSWARNINYVYPPAPMTGRLVTFLPSTQSRAVLAIPLPKGNAWWHFAIQANSAGVLAQIVVDGFLVTALDFREPQPNNLSATTGPHALMGAYTRLVPSYHARTLSAHLTVTYCYCRHITSAQGGV